MPPREVTVMESRKEYFNNHNNHREFYKYFLDHFEEVNLGGSFPKPSVLDELLVKSPFSGDKNIPRVTLWFAVDHFQEEYQKLKDRGVDFLYKPIRIKHGHAVEFRDRFGNRWGITDYPLKEAEK
jgi:hypothetical protein